MQTQSLTGALIFSLLAGAVFMAAAPTPTPSPTPAPAARGAARGGRGPATPATPADLAAMAKLMDLPPYAYNQDDGDYSVGPNYTPAEEVKARDGIPHGKIINFEMDSKESKIFPGQTAPFSRKVAVYVPAQYIPGTALPFIVSCDQYRLPNNELPNVLDNMIAEKRLPIMGAIMVANAGTDRSYEYDTVNSKYAEFVESEVLPRVEKETSVKLSKDPDARMTFGGSSGGICAFTMAWFHPELYHRVLSYSGTFVNLKNGPDAPHGGWEYHENFIPKTPAKPIRVWLHVSQNDNGNAAAASDYRNWVLANIGMASTLKAKGYHYQFVFAKNAGHTDAKVIANTLPQALEYVWRGYPIAK